MCTYMYMFNVKVHVYMYMYMYNVKDMCTYMMLSEMKQRKKERHHAMEK